MKFAMNQLIRLSAAAALCSAAALACAQDLDLNAMVGTGRQIAQAVDKNQTNALWDGASPVTRQSIPRDKFTANVQATRAPLGAMVSRNFAGISQQNFAGNAQLPAGTYISIEFATAFAGQPNLRELVSLRLDEDKTWRFTGYFLR